VCARCEFKGVVLDVNSVGDIVHIRSILSGSRTAPDCKGKEFRQIEMDGAVEKIICPQPPPPEECKNCDLTQYKGKKK